MEMPFVFTRIRWACQDGTMRRRFSEWAAMKAAWLLPHRVAYWAFIRVYASTGACPGPDFKPVCDAWEARAK